MFRINRGNKKFVWIALAVVGGVVAWKMGLIEKVKGMLGKSTSTGADTTANIDEELG